MTARTFVEHKQGGGVPGGHHVIGKYRNDGTKSTPFITPMKECDSIPLRHTDVVVDIGAYVGTYAIKAARFPVKQVVAYEPTPATFEILSATKLPNLTCVQAAVVGDDRQEVGLHISAGIGVTNSIVAPNRKETTVSVPAIRYETVTAKATIVKIDVEGGEYDFDIVQPSLRAVIIDFHPLPKFDWVAASNRIITELLDNGFRSVIEPRFDASGWDRAGSWIRDIEEPSAVYEPMMAGLECCGCGIAINTRGKGLCNNCWQVWLPKHRAGFLRNN